MSLESWGLYPPAPNQTSVDFQSLDQLKNLKKFLPRGNGRSYGDTCLASHHTLLSCLAQKHYQSFNAETGVLTCGGGVLLQHLLEDFLPKGFFPPVTPGTKFVTVAGCLANDIHGKNHHHEGSFARFVEKFTLLRSDGNQITCSRHENADLFRATVGGLGLTGFILDVTLKLKKISGPMIQQEQIKFRGLDEFICLSEESKSFLYTVAWVDCFSGENFKGIFIRGDHATNEAASTTPRDTFLPRLNIPFYFPSFALNKFSISAFNFLYDHKNHRKQLSSQTHFNPFFYPLDAVGSWNKIYGKSGFVQYQFVVPKTPEGQKVLKRIFQRLAEKKIGSFLTVLKTFGDFPEEGILSFPAEGLTLALDFKIDTETLTELEQFDQWILDAGGRLYPAKDARMSPSTFRRSFPRMNEWLKWKDPQIVSDFYHRVVQ